MFLDLKKTWLCVSSNHKLLCTYFQIWGTGHFWMCFIAIGMKTWQDLWITFTKQPKLQMNSLYRIKDYKNLLLKSFIKDHFLFCRSVEGVFVEGSGQQPEKPPKDPSPRYIRKDWSLRCVGMECFSMLWICTGERFFHTPCICRKSCPVGKSPFLYGCDLQILALPSKSGKRLPRAPAPAWHEALPIGFSCQSTWF